MADKVMSLNLESMDIEGLERRAALLANLNQLRSGVGNTGEELAELGCGTFSCGSYSPGPGPSDGPIM